MFDINSYLSYYESMKSIDNISMLFSYVRKLQSIRQGHISESLGIAQSSVARFEAMKATLSLGTIERIAPLLNIDPLYVSGESGNPFKSDKLIKMLLPEGLGSGIDFSILYFLAEKNLVLNLGLLVAPMKYYQKIFSVGALENPVYAIALKDQMGNHFIFRRKANYPLFGERELQIKLQEISNQYDHKISVEMKRIDEDLTKKIKSWTVGIEDIEPLFQHIEDPLIPTEKEIELLRALREPNADPRRIIKDFLKK